MFLQIIFILWHFINFADAGGCICATISRFKEHSLEELLHDSSTSGWCSDIFILSFHICTLEFQINGGILIERVLEEISKFNKQVGQNKLGGRNLIDGLSSVQ